MTERLLLILLCTALLTGSATGQTAVTNGNNGTTNAVPVYTGSATLGNSPIVVSGGNVGIGTGSPAAALDVWSRSAITTLNLTNQYNATSLSIGSSGPAGTPILITDSGFGSSITVNKTTASYLSNGNDDALDVTGTYQHYGSGGLGKGIYVNVTNNESSNTGYTLYGALVSATANASGNSVVGLSVTSSSTSGTSYSALFNGGNVGIGTTSPAFNLDVAGKIHTSTAVIFPDGSQQTTAWTGTVCGGDYAESVDVIGRRKSYKPGDVLVIDPNTPGKFLESADPYSTSVAGIYSTKPGLVGRRQGAPRNPDAVPMAMVGIVPTKVTAENGPIRPGDLLVTSSTLGYAMKGTNRSKMLGAVIGKALGSLDTGKGVIEVVVMLQ